MDRTDGSRFSEIEGRGAAMIDRVYLFYPILTQPSRNFRRRHTDGPGFLCDADQISGMIAAPMGDKYIVCFDLVGIDIFDKQVPGKKRVE